MKKVSWIAWFFFGIIALSRRRSRLYLRCAVRPPFQTRWYLSMWFWN